MVNVIKKLYLEFKDSKSRNNHLPDLKTSFDPKVTIQALRERRFTWQIILNYTIMIAVNLFTLAISPASIISKLIFCAFCILILLMPITSQFFNGALPILTWVFLFFSSSKIPMSLRPPISVKVLPATETILYGDNLSSILSSATNTPLDIIAWIPYGILHFSLPFVVSFLIFIFAPPGTLPRFCFCFGYTNLCGVIIQNLIFPAAPPWYKLLHGLDKADYSMPGSPGGLGRIDALLGIDLYTTTFTTSPLIFGAMPSLHSACSSLDALWLAWLFPRGSILFYFYVTWLWFSTMYLTHHYFVDLVVGTSLALGWFYWVRNLANSKDDLGHGLPINDKFCRWSYDEVKFTDLWSIDPLNSFGDSIDDDEFVIYDEDEYLNDPVTGELSTPVSDDPFADTDLTGSLELQDLSGSARSNH
ncbi:hypothetical protein CANARDRAFT_6861 [[Candida] arabinofermentans NRRL YB-2248]|uniref:Phosphatidic acid phosphatase type 2/haloperoxidase domain-containing protein n=1 Tax=[Candida] arabinofermentans NRRL YB-2248 TaxID=983967 RepID=A0A1E4T3T5_9ASCO|nr:hypothetical protein CANARDRAFT_6861 [[Candida] arabinofermentans NRRL YB-2248]